MSEPSRHNRFYFPDGNLTLLVRPCQPHRPPNSYYSPLKVSNTLFKVHRFHFHRYSDIFREMFTLEAPEGEQAEGTSDEHPIKLDGQNIEDLENFLSFLYPE
jgi:hypothetical protein